MVCNTYMRPCLLLHTLCKKQTTSASETSVPNTVKIMKLLMWATSKTNRTEEMRSFHCRMYGNKIFHSRSTAIRTHINRSSCTCGMVNMPFQTAPALLKIDTCLGFCARSYTCKSTRSTPLAGTKLYPSLASSLTSIRVMTWSSKPWTTSKPAYIQRKWN